MRKLIFVSLLLLTSLAFGQTWQPVASVVLLQQTQPIPLTTLYTPTGPGIYRVEYYFSAGGGAAAGGGFSSAVTVSDISGKTNASGFPGHCAGGNFFSTSYGVSLLENQPMTYEVDQQGSVSTGCVYNLSITVEQFK